MLHKVGKIDLLCLRPFPDLKSSFPFSEVVLELQEEQGDTAGCTILSALAFAGKQGI